MSAAASQKRGHPERPVLLGHRAQAPSCTDMLEEQLPDHVAVSVARLLLCCLFLTLGPSRPTVPCP